MSVTTSVSVRLDELQLAWLDAIAELHNCTRGQVVRAALVYFVAKESSRARRTRHYAVVQAIARAEQWDPISDYLSFWPIDNAR